jgi:hypothetical protein
MSVRSLLIKLEAINPKFARKKGEHQIEMMKNWSEFKTITSLKCCVSKLAVF